MDATYQSVPRTCTPRHEQVPWWSPHFTELIQEKHSLSRHISLFKRRFDQYSKLYNKDPSPKIFKQCIMLSLSLINLKPILNK